jgi:hypothetical protein
MKDKIKKKRAPAGKQEALNQMKPYGSFLILTRNAYANKKEGVR